MRRWRGLLWSLLLTLSVVLLLTFVSSGDSAEKVRIEFWHAMKPGTPRGEALQYLVDKFNEEHSGIQVIAVFKGSPKGNPYNKLFRELLMALSKGKPPAIAQCYENWTLQFLAADKVLPLQELIKDDPEFSSELSDFVEDFYRSNVVNGELVSLPFNKSIWALYYNGDIFDTFGLKPPRTWQELKNTSKFLYENTEIYGFAVNPTVDTFVTIYLTKYGKPLFSGLEPNFSQSEGVATMSYLKELVESGGAVVSKRSYKLFTSGETAMIIATTSKYERFKRKANFRVGIAPLPRERGRYPFAGTNLVIFKDVSREQQLAAYTFLKWLLKPENVTYFAMHTGYVPVRKSALRSHEYQRYLRENPELRTLLSTTFGKLEPQPPVWAWENVRYYLTDAVSNVLLDGASPSQELMKAHQLTLKIIENQKLFNKPFRYGAVFPRRVSQHSG